MKALLAGILIGIGDIALMSCGSTGIGTLLFSVALLTIIQLGLPLYTGRVGKVFEKRNYLFLLYTLCMNSLGCLLACAGYAVIHKDGLELIRAAAANKFGRGALTLFVAGILCNVLIHIAVLSKREIITVLAIMTFIMCGFEHSIADASYAILSGNLNSLLMWLVVIAGNTVGGILTEFLYTSNILSVNE